MWPKQRAWPHLARILDLPNGQVNRYSKCGLVSNKYYGGQRRGSYRSGRTQIKALRSLRTGLFDFPVRMEIAELKAKSQRSYALISLRLSCNLPCRFVCKLLKIREK